MARRISSSLMLVVEEIVISWLCPVPRSLAETFTMPFASISKVTSICGTPAIARRMPFRRKLPSSLLSRAKWRSPWSTLMSTAVWNGAAVVKIWLCRAGMVVLRSMILVATPPTVSMDRDSGVTSMRMMSCAAEETTMPLPGLPAASLPPCSAAPSATHSSGFIALLGVLPVILRTISCTAGMRVLPPTSSTWPSSPMESAASVITWLTGPAVRSIRSRVMPSNCARVTVMSM